MNPFRKQSSHGNKQAPSSKEGAVLRAVERNADTLVSAERDAQTVSEQSHASKDREVKNISAVLQNEVTTAQDPYVDTAAQSNALYVERAAFDQPHASEDGDAQATSANTQDGAAAHHRPRAATRARIWELDLLRSLAFLYMVFDYAMYMLAYVFREMWSGKGGGLGTLCEIAFGYYSSTVATILRFVLCAFLFMFICGISTTLSRRNLRRGMMILMLGIALSVTTWLIGLGVKRDFTVKFGILHFLGIAVLLGEAMKRLNRAWLVLIAVLSILLGFVFNTVTVTDTWIWPLFNFQSHGFVSAEFYPILPNLGFFVLGMLYGKVFYKDGTPKLPPSAHLKIFRPFEWIGRNTLWLYFVQIVVVFGLLYLLGVLL